MSIGGSSGKVDFEESWKSSGGGWWSEQKDKGDTSVMFLEPDGGGGYCEKRDNLIMKCYASGITTGLVWGVSVTEVKEEPEDFKDYKSPTDFLL